jgi:hypothetical protein
MDPSACVYQAGQLHRIPLHAGPVSAHTLPPNPGEGGWKLLPRGAAPAAVEAFVAWLDGQRAFAGTPDLKIPLPGPIRIGNLSYAAMLFARAGQQVGVYIYH